MALDGRPHAHIMLAVLTVEGIIHEIRVDQELGMMNVDPFMLLVRFYPL
jgi:hypothetical protein